MNLFLSPDGKALRIGDFAYQRDKDDILIITVITARTFVTGLVIVGTVALRWMAHLRSPRSSGSVFSASNYAGSYRRCPEIGRKSKTISGNGRYPVFDFHRTVPFPAVYLSTLPCASLSRRLFGRISVQFCSM
jgi:hypothetical protein